MYNEDSLSVFSLLHLLLFCLAFYNYSYGKSSILIKEREGGVGGGVGGVLSIARD